VYSLKITLFNQSFMFISYNETN